MHKGSNANSDERYLAFIRNSHEGIWCVEIDQPISTTVSEKEQLEVIFDRAYLSEANDAMAHMYGLESGNDLVGSRLTDLMDRHDKRNREYLLAFIRSGYRLSDVDSYEQDTDGNQKIFRNSLIGVIENDHIQRAWGTQQDITEQHKAEELKAANRALRNQQKQLMALNKSKDEFISLASHQLRTPATGVKQYVGMLLDGYAGPLTAKQRQLLQVAFESNERQMSIIDDLLRVAQVDAGKVTLNKELSDIGQLIQDVLKEQASRFAAREQHVIFTLPQPEIAGMIDRRRVRMVLENLTDNASKYTPIGKSITLALTQNDTHVCITVRDEGVGIAKRDMPRLFQKFSRLDNPLSTTVGGSGIGLYWAKRIIDIHGGTIDVISRLHKGSEFRVTIPLR